MSAIRFHIGVNFSDSRYIGTMTDLMHPCGVADFLLCESRERGDILTNLKLQKMLYYAQAWHLALFNKELFEEDFQAWVHGPVLPSQYQRFKEFQWKPIISDIDYPQTENKELVDFLNEIVDEFGSETAVALELMTHREKPWLEARGGLPSEAPSSNKISKELMFDFYRSL